MCCLFCNGQERNYKPDPGVEFICGTCVQLFLGASEEELSRAYQKALDKIAYWKEIVRETPAAADILESFERKKTAIRMFWKGGDKSAKTKRPKPNLARKRAVRKTRPSRRRQERQARTKQAA